MRLSRIILTARDFIRFRSGLTLLKYVVYRGGVTFSGCSVLLFAPVCLCDYAKWLNKKLTSIVTFFRLYLQYALQ